jgi:hypothetical protein
MTRRYRLGTKCLAGLLAGAMAVAVAPDAHAQAAKPKKAAAADAKVDAKKKYGDGVAKYKMGAYADALVDFQAADSVKQTPQAARYIGLCYDALSKFPDAVAAYQRFLANVPAKMHDDGEDTKVQQRIAEIQKMPAKLHVDSDPKGATVAVDTVAQPNVTPTDIDVAPGHHTLHFTAAGHDAADKDVDATYASKQDVTVTLPVSAPPPPAPVAIVAPPQAAPPPPAEAPAPAPPAEPVHHSLVPAYITGGLAVAAVGVGTVFGVMALNDKSNFDAHPTNSTADDGESHALICDMAFGVALTLGVTSLVLFLSNDESPAAAPAPAPTSEAPKTSAFSITATPIVTQHGGGAGALVRF